MVDHVNQFKIVKSMGIQLMNYNRAAGCIISVYCYYELCPIDICAQR